jgi:uncharacterized membrane protein YphA (DoxX/SURF4 family)
VAPVILALVLAAAAGSKLASPTRTRRSFEALGLPRPRALALGVPLAELAAAVLLVAVPRVGAPLALTLLVVFSAFLAPQVARGSEEPCACFGQVGSRPVSPVDLVRNGGLMALALLTVAWPPA